MKLIGVDLGGTKITAALIEDDKIVKLETSLTPFDQDKATVVKAVSDTISKIFDQEVLGIGVGVPGLVDLKNNTVIDVVNIPSCKEVPLKHLLEQNFLKPVFVNNDANCFALGEKYYGKGKHFRNFVGVTIGTGLGTGIVINDHLYSGMYCGAGEFGSMSYAGKTIEAFASGQFFKDLGFSGAEVYARAMEGNQDAMELFEEFGCHVGKAISTILFALAPEAIIMGGSVSQSHLLFSESMLAVLEEFPYRQLYRNTRIEFSDLKDSSVLGASSLVLDVLS